MVYDTVWFDNVCGLGYRRKFVCALDGSEFVGRLGRGCASPTAAVMSKSFVCLVEMRTARPSSAFYDNQARCQGTLSFPLLSYASCRSFCVGSACTTTVMDDVGAFGLGRLAAQHLWSAGVCTSILALYKQWIYGLYVELSTWETAHRLED